MKGFWTPTNETKLAYLWADESKPASKIARELGCTRNAVIGKVHRMNLAARKDSPVRYPLLGTSR